MALLLLLYYYPMKARLLFAVSVCFVVGPEGLFAQNNGDSGAVVKTTSQPNRVHKVLRGETLYKIAKQYGCTVDEIKKLNKNTEPLLIGARLIIPAAKSAPVNNVTKPTPVLPAPVTNKPVTEEKKDEVKDNVVLKVHTVVGGETLSKIALKYGTTVSELKTQNKLTSDGLRIGQKLTIPNSTAAKPTVAKQKDSSIAGTQANTDAKTTSAGTGGGPVKVAVKPNPVQQKDVNPGIPEKAVPQNQVIAEKIVEKEEVGKARVIKGKMDDTRTYAMHPSIPKGNIVVVIHPTSGRMAYCKIVDNYTPSQYEGSGIVITPAVAQKMGLNSATSFDVKIKYAAP